MNRKNKTKKIDSDSSVESLPVDGLEKDSKFNIVIAQVMGHRNLERLKDADRPSVHALLIANLVPLCGVLILGWDIGTIMPLYWVETLIIGFYAVLRIALAQGPPSGGTTSPKLFLIPFFCFHFGGFCGVHGMFLLLLFKLTSIDSITSDDDWPGFLVFVQLLFNVIRAMIEVLGISGLVAAAGLFISHGISFSRNYLGRGEYKRAQPAWEMIKPYGRIVLLHVGIIFGGGAVALFGSPMALLIIFVAMKLVVDLRVHLRSHNANSFATGQP